MSEGEKMGGRYKRLGGRGKRERQTDRQTDRQAGRQASKQAGRPRGKDIQSQRDASTA